MKHFIHLLTDYGTGDPAFGEVIQRTQALIPEATIYPTSVGPFDTLATGYWIYQFGLGPHPQPMTIFANTAPRKDKKKARKHNEGEKMMYGVLGNGVGVLAVNAGYCFSFIKPELAEFRVVTVENKGSQFRSRDFYPQALANIITHKKGLGKTISIATIPDVPDNHVAWTDGYGNMKTTIRKSAVTYAPGTKVKVIINGVIRTALVAGGNFSVAEGELSFSPGSSGFSDPFMELFLRGGSAHSLFNMPPTQAEILISD
jgi:S-adenosylmethionine hydrolase